MNVERIKELANQAREFAMQQWGKQDDVEKVYNYTAFEEKFAELMVKECIAVLDPSGDLTSMNEEMGRLSAMATLQRHFDIK